MSRTRKTFPTTLEEHVTRRQDLVDRLEDASVNDAEIRMLAIGAWKSYPASWGFCVRQKNDDWRKPLVECTNAVHAAATRFLMRLAYTHDLDGGALWEAGQLCQQLFRHHQEWLRDVWDAFSPDWPECLDRKRFGLSSDENRIISDGERVFQRLLLLPSVERGKAEAAETKPIDHGQDQEVEVKQDRTVKESPPISLLTKLTPLQRRIVKYLWDRPSVSRDEFVQAVWPDKTNFPSTDQRTVRRLQLKLLGFRKVKGLEQYGDIEVELKEDFVTFNRPDNSGQN